MLGHPVAALLFCDARESRVSAKITTMALQEHNYWLTTAEIPATDSSHPLPEMVDVAVIGSGFTGLSAARTLAKRGAKVGVLEAETIGWGASSRNGGMVLTGMKLDRKSVV